MTGMRAQDAFLDNMQQLLGDEFAAFRAGFDEPGRVGLRVNTLKVSPADFSRVAPFRLDALGAHLPAGFLVGDDAARPGKHPYHAAGLYYLQEPAAMTVAALLDPQPGERVLDLAAAPGGKTTHIAALMRDTGLLVANDVAANRARILADNLERWGTRSTLVLNETPQRLAQQFGALFDRVLLDAPCSGEGMARRRAQRQEPFEWSEAMVAACARRQALILPDAARLVRPGGLLVYATCTFAPEENEQVVADFLRQQPDFTLEAAPAWPGFAPARPDWVDAAVPAAIRAQLARAVRLWPHRYPGEGHFVALLRRADGGAPPARPPAPLAGGRTGASAWREALDVWRAFAAQELRETWDVERLVVGGGRVYYLPQDRIDTGRLRLVRYGLLLGEARKGHFRPAHALALALRPSAFRSALNFAAEDAELLRYLAGHDMAAGVEGWTLVTVDGFGVGWGKGSNGRVRNHYPRHWRW